MKKLFAIGLIAISASNAAFGASEGQITPELLSSLRANQPNTPAERALRNALSQIDINKLAINAENANPVEQKFSHRVESKGITNQKSSGRCWLFTGLNVIRAKMMASHDLPKLELSQNYNFFYDQLEKSNLFLQTIIDTYNLPMDDKKVEWLFKNPLSDGGQYTGFSENVMKYGVIPAEAWVENNCSNNTSQMSRLVALKLRENGLELRNMLANDNDLKAAAQRKEQMLGEIYHMLALTLGAPPTEFEWTRKDSNGNIIDRRKYTPQSFYKEYCGDDLCSNYVMLMNDPTRPYYQLYEIDLDRHIYDGQNWTYINLPINEIKDAAIKSIKDSNMMYFSCDVGKFLDRSRGLLDVNNFNYDDLLGTTFGMNKAQRISTFASASSHAMALMAVDINDDGKPTRWMVENSWGTGANNGHLIMTDQWFEEYMFRLVVNKKYLPKNILDILKQQPKLLPAWDPMFAEEQ